uniref:Ubiquitin-like protease family profile domain-containing protein n=1 Tax=Setaria italica TaxID=4555 RepID=K3ZFG3_SETIT
MELMPTDVDISQQVLIPNKSNESEDVFEIQEGSYVWFIYQILAEPGREELVLIDGVLVNRNHMECLFCRNTYLYDEVINAYIHLLWTQHNMINRLGGTCYLENTSIAVLMRGDSEEKWSMEDHYPPGLYTHWYLVVVNARRRMIHLKGLRMQMEYTLQCTGLKKHAWSNVNVDTWDVVQVMVDRIQFDGVSCGLFMERMVKFNTKMAATLLSTIFNERLGKPLLRNEDENIGSPSDVREIVEPNEIQQIEQKRKSTNGHENALKPKKIDTEIDLDKQDVLLYYKDGPLKRDELAEIFCDYILTIEVPVELDMVWLTCHEKYRTCRSAKELGDVIGGWKIVKYDILGCRSPFHVVICSLHFVVLILSALQFLLPWKHVNNYLLYVLNIKRKKLIVIDTKPIPNYATDVPYKHYAIQIVGFCLKF